VSRKGGAACCRHPDSAVGMARAGQRRAWRVRARRGQNMAMAADKWALAIARGGAGKVGAVPQTGQIISKFEI
jgi:hypothetical protein